MTASKKIYEDCAICCGDDRPGIKQNCPCCNGRGIVETGLTVPQLDRMRRDLRECYRLASLTNLRQVVAIAEKYVTNPAERIKPMKTSPDFQQGLQACRKAIFAAPQNVAKALEYVNGYREGLFELTLLQQMNGSAVGPT